MDGMQRTFQKYKKYSGDLLHLQRETEKNWLSHRGYPQIGASDCESLLAKQAAAHKLHEHRCVPGPVGHLDNKQEEPEPELVSYEYSFLFTLIG